MLSALGAALVGTSLLVASSSATPVLAVSADVKAVTSVATPSVSSGLARGARGDHVAALQRALMAAEVTVRGGADGIFGSATETALRAFQISVGLRSTGVLDAVTAHLLDLGPPPEFPTRGQRGEAVAELQRALITSGISVRGGADGIFGPVTSEAIARYQERHDLSVSGRVDVRTAIKLGVIDQDAHAATTGSSAPAVATDETAKNAGEADDASPVVGTPTAVDIATSAILPRRGDTNQAVAVVQRALIAAGVTVRGGADGIFGSATENAVKFYQRNVRRPATGEVDEKTAQLLGVLPAPTVPRRGDRSDDVAVIQRALTTAGVTVRGGADGVFGSATEGAITTYQSQLGLTASGRLDLVTYFALMDGTTATPPSDETANSSKDSSGRPTATTDPIRASVFPVQGPCWFTDTWHAPRSGGRRHVGVDIIAPTGKAVYAVVDGMITRQWFDKPGSLGGNAFRLTAEDDSYFHYAHLSEFAPGVELGSEVVAGQIIGYVGSTGSSSTPHLHLEYHPFGGSAVNPYGMVKSIDACKATELLPQPSAS